MAGSNIFSRSPVINVDFALVDSGKSNNTTDALNTSGPLAYFGRCAGVPPTTANTFQRGCILIQTDSTNGTQAIWVNNGSSLLPVWSKINQEAQIVSSATIAATGTTGALAIAPFSGTISDIEFSSQGALTASSSGILTFSVVNLGQNGTGTQQVLLVSTPSTSNNTSVANGTAIVAYARRQLQLTTTTANLNVNAGDILQITASTSGTLANTITLPTYEIVYQ